MDKGRSHDKLLLCFGLVLFALSLSHGGELDLEYLPFIICSSLILLFAVARKGSFNSKFSFQCTLVMALFFLSLLNNTLIFTFQGLPSNSLNLLEQLGKQNLEINLNKDWLPLLYSFSYIITFLIALTCVKTQKDLLTVFNILFAIAAILSIYSLLNYFSNGAYLINSTLTPFTNEQWNLRARGTFSYHAQFSAFLNSMVPVSLALTYKYGKQLKSQGNSRLKLIIDFLCSRTFLYATGSILIAIASIKTGSRVGGLILLLTFTIWAASALFLPKRSSNTKSKKTLLFSATSLAFMFFYFSGVADNLVARYKTDGLDLHGRQHLISTPFEAAKESNYLGLGLGNYSAFSKNNKPFELGLNIRSEEDYAINDYLQIYAEQGIIGLVLVLTIIFLTYNELFKYYRSERNISLYILACSISLSSIIIHSIFDFILQLPIMMNIFMIMLAICLRSNTIHDVHLKLGRSNK